MTDAALPRSHNRSPFAGLMSGTVGPVIVVVAAIIAIWYIACWAFI